MSQFENSFTYALFTQSNKNTISFTYKVKKILIQTIYVYTKVHKTNKVIAAILSGLSYVLESLNFPILLFYVSRFSRSKSSSSAHFTFPCTNRRCNFMLPLEVTAFSFGVTLIPISILAARGGLSGDFNIKKLFKYKNMV